MKYIKKNDKEELTKFIKSLKLKNCVLKTLEKEGVDKIICLGDFIGRSKKI